MAPSSTTLMKRIFPALLLCFGIAFSACQKELSYEVDRGNTGGSGGSGSNGGGSSSGYYIKGKKDGTAFNFTTYPMATTINAAGNMMVSINANAAMPNTSLESIALSISFNNGTTLATGTYAENDGSMDHIVMGVYNPNSMTTAWAAGMNPTPAKPLKIVISAKSSSEISGTFEGSFYKEDLTGGSISQTDAITFTEGEFKVPVK